MKTDEDTVTIVGEHCFGLKFVLAQYTEKLETFNMDQYMHGI